MTDEQRYIRGFNHGYVLTKYEPGLVSKMLKSLAPATGYLDGFFNGKEEWELELSRRHLDELEQLRAKQREQGLDLERE